MLPLSVLYLLAVIFKYDVCVSHDPTLEVDVQHWAMSMRAIFMTVCHMRYNGHATAGSSIFEYLVTVE